MLFELTPEDAELAAETCFHQADRLREIYERSNSLTKFRVAEKAERLMRIAQVLRNTVTVTPDVTHPEQPANSANGGER